MRHCHECGSEIAEIDIFCPFCGITQQPAQEQTFAISQSEFADLVGINSEAADINSITENPDTQTESEMPEDNKEAGQPPKITSENWAGKTDSIDIPAQVVPDIEDLPADISIEETLEIPEDSKPEEEQFDIEEQAEAVLETDTPKPSILDSANLLAEIPLKLFQPDSGSSASVKPRLYYEDKKSEDVPSGDLLEIEEEIPGEIEDSETISDAAVKTDEKSDSSDKMEMDFSSTIPYTPENLKIYSGEIRKDKVKSQNAAAGLEQTDDNAIHIPDEPIDMPDDDNPQFDSVRIIEDKASNVETLLKSVGNPLSNPPKKFEDNKPPEILPALEKVGSSFTTPNFGKSDTEGNRKGAKLKPLDEGTVLNSRYEIVRKIGGGGMGAVYLATDKNLGGILRAVKEMVQSYIEETAQDKAVSDFKRESMLLTSLDHPSIPTIYDYFFDEKENRFYLVMKYISGGDLASRLRSATEGRIEEENVTEWAIQVADVLDYLHNRQPPIVYRDLKPSNIMIDGNSGRVMLIDFGIARWINKEEKGVTAVGTMGYAPPELFSGNVEPRSDIYSLGSTMFHLLTGADPQSNPLLIFDFQRHPRPRQINPQLSDQIEKILMRAVEYSADNRFKTAAELKNILNEHLQNLRIGRITYGIAKSPRAVSLADQFVFCGFCGQKIIATDMFCAFCGSKQPLAQQGVNSAEYISPMATAKLLIIGTSDLDSPAYNLEKDENLVGRRDPLSNIFPEIDLSKYDPQTKVSRRHARIWREGGLFLIEDLGSSNGTVVMRVVGDSFRLIPHQPHPLTNGEKVKVGDTTLRFIVG